MAVLSWHKKNTNDTIYFLQSHFCITSIGLTHSKILKKMCSRKEELKVAQKPGKKDVNKIAKFWRGNMILGDRNKCKWVANFS